MYETRNIEDEKILQDKNRIKAIRIELLRLMALDDEWHRDETLGKIKNQCWNKRKKLCIVLIRRTVKF